MIQIQETDELFTKPLTPLAERTTVTTPAMTETEFDLMINAAARFTTHVGAENTPDITAMTHEVSTLLLPFDTAIGLKTDWDKHPSGAHWAMPS